MPPVLFTLGPDNVFIVVGGQIYHIPYDRTLHQYGVGLEQLL